MDDCRLIVDAPATGAWNMAVDEALLMAAPAGRPTLRFYQWGEPTLSLGYFQHLADREQHAASSACDCVRRVTGGGAILHDIELTYSFTTSIDDRWGRNAENLYSLFHETLAATLAAEWQIQAQLCGEERAACAKKTGAPPPFLCFERRSCLDLLAGEGKIAGSAQRRHQQALLQHGSVLVATSPVAPELPGLAELTGKTIAPHELSQAWQERIQHELGVRCLEEPLTADEIAAAQAWQQERFSSPTWLARR